jgi:hypothetical protein
MNPVNPIYHDSFLDSISHHRPAVNGSSTKKRLINPAGHGLVRLIWRRFLAGGIHAPAFPAMQSHCLVKVI